MRVTKKSITRLASKYRRTGSVANLPRRPRGVFMVLSHLRQRKRTAVETARATVGTHGRPISSNTVRSRLRSVGIRARRPYRGIVLRGHHRRARVRWARTHLRFTRADWA
jgi:hypothetical protein